VDQQPARNEQAASFNHLAGNVAIRPIPILALTSLSHSFV